MTTRLIAQHPSRIRPLCLSAGLSAGLVASISFMATNTVAIGADGSSGSVTNKATWFDEIPPDQNGPLGTPRIATDIPFPGTNNWCSNWSWYYAPDPEATVDQGFGHPIFPLPWLASGKYYGLRLSNFSPVIPDQAPAVIDGLRMLKAQELDPRCENAATYKYRGWSKDVSDMDTSQLQWQDQQDIVVSVDGLVNESSRPASLEVTDQGDWSVSGRWRNEGKNDVSLDVTLVRGMPFVFGEAAGGDIEIYVVPQTFGQFNGSGDASTSNLSIEDFGFLPGSDEREYCFQVSGKTYSVHLYGTGTDDRWTAAPNQQGGNLVGLKLTAPEGKFAIATLAIEEFGTPTPSDRQSYHDASLARVKSTKFTYEFEPEPTPGQVITTFEYELEAGATGPLVTGLFRHQYTTLRGTKNSLGDDAAFGSSFHTAGLGDLELYTVDDDSSSGNPTFTVTYGFPGFIPQIPVAESIDHEALISDIKAVADLHVVGRSTDVIPNPAECGGDKALEFDPEKPSACFSVATAMSAGTYSAGKELGKMTQLLGIAEQLHESELSEQINGYLQSNLEDWFTTDWSNNPFVGCNYDKGSGQDLCGFPQDGFRFADFTPDPKNPESTWSVVTTQVGDEQGQRDVLEIGQLPNASSKVVFRHPVDFGPMGADKNSAWAYQFKYETAASALIEVYLDEEKPENLIFSEGVGASGGVPTSGWRIFQPGNRIEATGEHEIILVVTGQLDAKHKLYLADVGLNYTGWNAKRFFAYDETWGSMIGYPEQFFSATELTDHHFYAGYFIMAAAAVANYDMNKNGENATWADEWKLGVEQLIRDVANWERPELTDSSKYGQMYPYLRYFDPISGHSWASGHGAFGDGNNEESSSEALNFAAATYYWGVVIGDDDIRDVGAMLYTVTSAAIAQYWFDAEQKVLSPEYLQIVHQSEKTGQVELLDYESTQRTLVWDAKGGMTTWFSCNPNQIQGIILLPITPASLHFQTFLVDDSASENENLMDRSWANLVDVSFGGVTSVESGYWVNILRMAQSMGAKAESRNSALEWFDRVDDQYGPHDPSVLPNEDTFGFWSYKDGESKAHTRHWIYAMNELGPSTVHVDAYVTSGVASGMATWPHVRTFVKDGVQTHVAWNPTAERIFVRFDGQKTGGCVPAGQVRVVRDGDLSCSAPGCRGDFNFDRRVDGEDLSDLLAAWGSCEEGRICRYDLNDDGSITGADIGLVFGSWGDCP